MIDDERIEKPQQKKPHTDFVHKLDRSALLMVIGIIILFSASIAVVLIAPLYVDNTWINPTTPYQVQMYEIEDPHVYLSSVTSQGITLEYVHHVIQDFTLLAFKESANVRLMASKELEKFITRLGDPVLKLTSRLLLLRNPEGESRKKADELANQLRKKWEQENPQWKEQNLIPVTYQVMELYDPQMKEAFVTNPMGGALENWVDENFLVTDETVKQAYHQDYGVVYVLNPIEYRISPYRFANQKSWHYDATGKPVISLSELQSNELGFRSRQELIYEGERIYAIEGCWYCHTDQTRTLVQDVVLNGSDSYPAPPSSPNEYIYQKVTFPGTRRIGPDLSRVGIKRPSRDWHKAHFWAPKTASAGSIMPSFQHFFDDDPRGTSKSTIGIPNRRFESVYQYLMTKGTRITPPTQAWWLGKDPIRTIEIIEGRRELE